MVSKLIGPASNIQPRQPIQILSAYVIHSGREYLQPIQIMAETDHILNKALRRLCEERLLPNLVTSMSQQLSANTKLDYKRKVLSKYREQLRIPRHYNPEEGKTKRQLFQQKMHRIINHQIPIEYCGVMVSKDGKKIPTYRGKPLDSVPVQTKEEFKIFKDFNYDNFIRDKLDVVWDDHAEPRSDTPLYNPYEVTKIIEKRNRLYTVNQKSQQQQLKIQQKKESRQIYLSTDTAKPEKPRFHSQSVRLPSLSQLPSTRLVLKTKIQTGRSLCKNQNGQITQKFRVIGGYNKLSSETQSITKQSIVKYLKRYIYKPIRIVDFLQIKSVETLESYILLVKRVKNMPKKHRNFMCFLFYDTNNDAVICQNDLSRLRNLTKNPSHLEADYQRLLKAKHSEKIQIPPEFDLYRLPEITQASYFNFLQKSPERKQELEFEKLITEETYDGDSVLLSLKKKYRIDFERFEKAFKGEKPGLWYLLMDLLGGLRYQGVAYF